MFVPLTLYLQWYTKELQQYEENYYHSVFSNLLARPKTKVSDKKIFYVQQWKFKKFSIFSDP